MQEPSDIFMIYDGACPICRLGASKFTPDPTRFTLILINARDTENGAIMGEIRAAKMDLNEGFVVKHNGKLYHGREAMRFCAARSKNASWLDHLLASRLGSSLLYPIFVRIRALSIRINGAGQIQQ